MANKIMMVRAPEDMQNYLKRYANQLGIARNALVMLILSDWMESKRSEQ